MATPIDEKCIRQTPQIRISDSLYSALAELAAIDDRSLSEYIRVVLMRHVFGHRPTLRDQSQDGNS